MKEMKTVTKLVVVLLLCMASFTGYTNVLNAEETEEVEQTEETNGEELDIPVSEEETEDIVEEEIVNEEPIETEEVEQTGALQPLPRSGGNFETDGEGTWWVNTDGGVRVAILNYDPYVGWKAGVVYQVKVTVDFTDFNGTGKSITVNLPEGIKYTGYEVKGTPITGGPGKTMTGVNDGLITSSTEPTKNAYYNSYYGSLVYQVKDNDSKKVEFSITVTPDVTVYYGPKTFVDGIQVQATKNGGSIGQVGIDVNAIGNVDYRLTGSSAVADTVSGVSNSDEVLTLRPLAVYRAGDFYGITQYYKNVDMEYCYPKEVVLSSWSTGMVEKDESTGYVKFNVQNMVGTSTGYQGINFKLTNVAPGTYSATKKAKATITHYDGTVQEIEYGGTLKVVAIDGSTIANKLNLTAGDRVYQEIADDYQISGPLFRITNSAKEKTNQYVEITIDPTYEVTDIILPYDQTPIMEVQYKTNLNPTLQTASGDAIKSTTAKSVNVTQKSLGLASNEYITYVTAKMGTISTEFQSSTSYQYVNTSNRLKVIGKLTDGVDEASVTLKTYSKDDSDIVDPDSINSVTGKVTRQASTSAAFAVPATSVIVEAGKTEKATFTASNGVYLYTQTIGAKNPRLYIKMPEHVTIPTASIKVTSSVDGDLGYDANYITSNVDGQRYLEIQVYGNVGSFFGGKSPEIKVTVDIQTSVQAKGNYKWSDYAFWDFNFVSYTAYNGYLNPVNNIINPGDIMIPVQREKDFIITAKEELMVDTYIIPEGQTEAKPEYDASTEETKKATAVGFTPSAIGNYTVEIFNNRKDVVNEVTTYIPVPKYNDITNLGYDFGESFQSQPFSWNMKLSQEPVLKVYDSNGNDVTATKGANYILEYSSDATNESNYQSATYGTFSDATSMVRVRNDSGDILPGEKAVISLKYVVDETIASVNADINKLGSINDFRPYFIFDAGSVGANSGTRVGAILEIGEISGSIFLDKDFDGIKNNDDTWIMGKIITLKNSNGVETTTSTDAYGNYVFNNLSSGLYTINFNGVTTSTTPYFTFKNKQGSGEVGSVVDNTGTSTGLISNVDPTAESAKVMNVGVLDYNTFIVTGNAVAVREANLQAVGTTAGITPTINVENFDNLKATMGAITYTSNDTSIATVSGSGVVTGVMQGTTTVTISVTDVFGNTKTANVTVSVGSNKIPTITLTNTTETIELQSSTFDVKDYIASVSDVEDTGLTIDDVVITGTPVINQKGSFTLTYRITDSDGNYAEAPIVFTVTDTTNPIFTITNTNVSLEINGNTTLENMISKLGSITKSDNDSMADLTIKSDDFSSLNQTTLSSNQTVTIYVEDPSGNKTLHTITVNIVDTIKPVFTITNTEVDLEINGNTSLEDFLTKVGVTGVSDNSLETMTVTSTDFSSLDQTTVGDNQEVTIYVEDSSGNRTAHTINVTIVDTVDPVFTITNTEVSLEINGNSSFEDFLTKVGITETSDNSLETMTVESTDFSDLDQTTLGNDQEVTIYIEDSSGNEVAHVITVNIVDTVDPVFTITNTEVSLEINGNSSFEDFLTKVGVTETSDNSLETMTVESTDFSDLDQTTLGNDQEVTIYVEDSSGNQVAHVIAVNIVDTTIPVVTTDLVTVSYRAGSEVTEQDFFNEIGLQVSDNSLIEPTVSSTFNTVDFNPMDLEDSKVFMVTITITDTSGNITTKEVQVNIVRKTMYYIEGKDVELTMDELTSYINDNTLEKNILNSAEAKAWKDDYLDGVTELPVYIKDLSALQLANAGEEVTMELVLKNPKEKANRVLASDSTLENVIGTITVKIKEEVSIEEKPVVADNTTNTADSLAKTMDKMLLVVGLAVIGMVILLKTKKTKD